MNRIYQKHPVIKHVDDIKDFIVASVNFQKK